MIKYYSLSKLILDGINIEPIIDQILYITISAKTTYPEYTEWFLQKHIPGIYEGTRDTIIAVHNEKIVGVSTYTSEGSLLSLSFIVEEFSGVVLTSGVVEGLRLSES